MRLIARAVMIGVLVVSASAHAGPATDKLSQCLVKSSDKNTRGALVQWMFAAMSLHPDVKRMANVADADREALNRQLASIVEELLTKSCAAETREAMKQDGPASISGSFTTLGQLAGQELFANPDVAAGLAGLGKYFDEKKLQSVLKGE